VCVRKLQNNAYIKRFISGKTRARVHFKSDLSLATDFENQMLPQDTVPRAMSPRQIVPMVKASQSPMVRKVRYDEEFSPEVDVNSENRPLYSPIKPRRPTSELDESWASFMTEDTHKDPPSTVFVLTPNNHGRARPPHARGRRDPPSFRQ